MGTLVISSAVFFIPEFKNCLVFFLKPLLKLPPRVLGLAIEWATMYSKELSDAWKAASKGESIPKIPPLA